MSKRGRWKKDKNDRGIYKRGRTWYVRFADRVGRLHYERVGPSKALALKVYQKRKTEIAEGRFFPTAGRLKPVLFDELLDDSLAHSKAHNGVETWKHANFHKPRPLEWFGGREAQTITVMDIEETLNKLAADGLKPATINRYRAQLSITFSLGQRHQKVTVNPVHQTHSRRENNARTRFLSEAEEMKLRAAIRKAYPERECDLDLALNTGMRRGEQYGLTWENVDLPLAMATIPRSKHGERRYIHLNTTAVAALKVLAARSKQLSGPVCAPVRRCHERWFETCAQAAGLTDFRWHDLRHTFASRLVMAGVDLRTVQELMGHKTIMMTVRYSHLAPKHLRDAVERLAGVTASVTATEPTPATRPTGSAYLQ